MEVFELLLYPYLVALLLFTFHFLSRDLLSTVSASEELISGSFRALDHSNLLLLNCTLDHVECALPSPGRYPVRRLVIVGGEVKELIYYAPE